MYLIVFNINQIHCYNNRVANQQKQSQDFKELSRCRINETHINLWINLLTNDNIVDSQKILLLSFKHPVCSDCF